MHGEAGVNDMVDAADVHGEAGVNDMVDAADVDEVIDIEVPPRPDYVSFVRVVVAAAAELDPGLGPSRVDDLRVAVSEATTNAIRAHLRTGSDRPIRVRCRRAAGRVSVVVRDEGSGFDPDSVPEMPAPDSPDRLRHESGMGLSIIRTLADDLRISSSPAGTELRLMLATDPSDEPQ